MYKFLIIEDDAAAAKQLRDYVERYLDAHNLEAHIEWLENAFEFVDMKKTYDLIFMDIDLPGIDGMEAARQLRESNSETLLVFVTDLAKYAVKGYEVDALDFVVKPITHQEVSMRMDRVMRTLAARPATNIRVLTRTGMSVFPVRSLIYVEIRGHDLTFHLSDGADIRTRGTIKSFCEEYSLPQLIRISSGIVVNADNVRRINGQSVIMCNGDDLQMSRPKRKAALESFARYYGGN